MEKCMASSDKINERENAHNGDLGESDEHAASSGGERLFSDFDREWEAADPRRAPLLAEFMANRRRHRRAWAAKADTAAATGSPTAQNGALPKSLLDSPPAKDADGFSHRRRSVMFAALPFHHLIPLQKLAPAFTAMPDALLRPKTGGEILERRQLFWRTLAAEGLSAPEAALFDDSVHCRFTDAGRAGGADPVARFELDWEVLFHDELQGCAEMYRSELLIVKRRIFEAGDALRAVLELRSDEFLHHLTDGIAPETAAVIETEHLPRWFLHNLFASCNLTVSRFRENSEISPENKKKRKTKAHPDEFASYRTEVTRRVASSLSTGLEDTADSSEITVYRLHLADYWLDWQHAARAADFDFDWLATLTDVRAMRFYELTKLWRLQAIADTAADILTPVNLPNALEIEYDRFAALLPLPRLRSTWEVTNQIGEIIKPLKAAGYVKSFAVKNDWRGLDRAGRLVFKFRDDFSSDQNE